MYVCMHTSGRGTGPSAAFTLSATPYQGNQLNSPPHRPAPNASNIPPRLLDCGPGKHARERAEDPRSVPQRLNAPPCHCASHHATGEVPVPVPVPARARTAAEGRGPPPGFGPVRLCVGGGNGGAGGGIARNCGGCGGWRRRSHDTASAAGGRVRGKDIRRRRKGGDDHPR